MADPCFHYKANDDMHLYLLVHVDDDTCALIDPSDFEAWLQYFRDDPHFDSSLDVRLLTDVTSFLQMRIQSTLYLDQERQILQLAVK